MPDEARFNGVAFVLDITDRKHHERHEREIEAQKREFDGRTILAATEETGNLGTGGD